MSEKTALHDSCLVTVRVLVDSLIIVYRYNAINREPLLIEVEPLFVIREPLLLLLLDHCI